MLLLRSTAAAATRFPHFEKCDPISDGDCGMHRRRHGLPAAQDDDDHFVKAWRPLELEMSPISADICRFVERVGEREASPLLFFRVPHVLHVIIVT